ncbi:DUF4258 domain-containing protein [Methylobacterium sp. J-088]|uniref:DUF4258 domain-containing protein n=1 Tax=unclassified Methylobacterium TaxID=2615210 RepID=UPI001FBA8F29|nr:MULTISPECIES: DUF4258 domain-containing protein [unclassified Methylobacterium]MCJ2065126.1 DUF4258 domain-containing protein [Methylobacterium sp. J-088]
MPAFVYTRHAMNNMADRGIDRALVERTVLAPEATEPDPQYPERVRAYCAVPEFGGRILRVVYVEEPALTYRIITLFLDRGRRRRHESQIRSGG